MMGATNPVNAAPGTIRGDLATETQNNVTHGSDSPESAAREIALFFPDLGYTPAASGSGTQGEPSVGCATGLP